MRNLIVLNDGLFLVVGSLLHLLDVCPRCCVVKTIIILERAEAGTDFVLEWIFQLDGFFLILPT